MRFSAAQRRARRLRLPDTATATDGPSASSPPANAMAVAALRSARGLPAGSEAWGRVGGGPGRKGGSGLLVELVLPFFFLTGGENRANQKEQNITRRIR